jgi:hypothetical protein
MVHPKIVSERLGHSTIAITMDLYSHLMPTLQKEAIGGRTICSRARKFGGNSGARDHPSMVL